MARRGCGARGVRVRDLRVGLGLDWGNRTGCVVWAAALPNGHVSIFDEYKFSHQTAKDVADAVKEKCKEWGLKSVPSCACDPSLLPATKNERGEWIGHTLIRHGLPVSRVSNDRPNGWQRIHEALSIDPATGTPWLTLHPRCRYGIRTFPLMIQSKNNPEDLETDSDDHFLDATRYLFMGGLRPTTGQRVVPQAAPYSLAWYRKMFRGEPRGVLA